MNICYVANKSLGLTGANQSLINLIGNKIWQNEISMIIVCNRNAEPIISLKRKGIKTTIIRGVAPVWKKDRKERSLSEWVKGFLKWPYCWLHIVQAIYFLWKNKIELIHFNSAFCNPALAYAALLLKIPYIWHIREFVDEDHGLSYICKKKYFRLMCSAYEVIAVSDSIKEKWESLLGRNIRVIYNGIPESGNLQEDKVVLTSNRIKLFLAGRIDEKKGQMDAIQAVEQLLEEGYVQYRLTIVGYRGFFDYEKRLKAYIEERKLDSYIKILDFTDDLAKIRRDQDVGLLCSKKEAFGRVTIENMLSGLLMVGTNSGGTKELIKNGNTGLLYEPGDVQGLKEILLKIGCERTEMQDIAKRGQAFAREHFLIEKTAEQILDIYQKILMKNES